MRNLLRAVWCSIFRCIECDDNVVVVRQELQEVEARMAKMIVVNDNRIARILRRLEPEL